MTDPIRVLTKDPDAGLSLFGGDDIVTLSWLRHVEKVATSDPRRGLSLCQTAVLLAERLGVRCIHVRAVADLGAIYRAVGQHGVSEETFRQAFKIANGCRCLYCGGKLALAFAHLRIEQERFSDALTLADDVDWPDLEGEKLFCRGTAHFYSESYYDARNDYEAALLWFEPTSHYYYPAQHAFVCALGKSGEVAEARRLLEAIESGFVGIRDRPKERGHHSWLKATILAACSEVEPDPKGNLKTRARKSFRQAAKAFEALGLQYELAAVYADLAAFETRRERLAEAKAALLESDLFSTKLERKIQAARTALQGAISGDAFLEQAWEALRALRNATISAGQAPALIPYAVRR